MTGIRPIAQALDRPVRIAALVSGGGSTLDNIRAKIADGQLNAEVVQVIASRADCAGVEKAHAANLPCQVISRKDFADVIEFSDAIFSLCREARADLVTLAGYLQLIEIPDDFHLRVMNIHPALIPSFCGHGYYGHHVHEAVLGRGAKVSGCTVHFADNQYDHGPIIVQRCVPVAEGDTPDSLAARVFQAECEAYPEAIRLFASGRLEICANRVCVLPE